MAGTYRSKGSGITSSVARLVNAKEMARVAPAKREYAHNKAKELITYKASAKTKTQQTIIKTKGSEARRTATHRGKVQVNTAIAKANIKKGGKK